jgi:putative colanic acid biosynthesis UDP-glucose lipid carrier transferase
MLQRFSDILILFLGLYVVCLINGLRFDYKGVFLSLVALAIFQMIGGMTDFYRSWRGVKLYTELSLILKNWVLTLLITSGALSFIDELSIYFNVNIISQWLIVVSLGFIACRVFIRFSIGLIRKLGYNCRRVALAGSMPDGINLLNSFKEQPWLGLVVEGFMMIILK